MVDASGSTLSDDAGAIVRTTSVQNFLTANAGATNLSFSYSNFAVNELTYDYSTSAFSATPSSAVFGTDAQAMGAVTAFLNTYKTIPNQGTDYQSALATLGSLVNADNVANPGKYSYAAVFMSDGQPNRGPSTSTGIDPLVTALINTVGPNRMTMSAVYFNNVQSNSDLQLIDNMALAGNGQFANGDSQNLTLATMIQNIITVPTAACPAAAH